jgi:hypothetical protein
MAKQKAGVVWVNVYGKAFYLSRGRPVWSEGLENWLAPKEDSITRKRLGAILGLRGLKHLHVYRVDLIKALQGKPFILETLKPPKGDK